MTKKAAESAAPKPVKKAATKRVRKAAPRPAPAAPATREPETAAPAGGEPAPPQPAPPARREPAPPARRESAPEPAPVPPVLPLPASTPPAAWAEAVWEAVRHAGQPPRRLADLAVAEAGPLAAEWADWLRRTYPDAPADGIARLATREARRFGWIPLGAGVAGPLAPAVHLAATAWVRTVLVLRIAAAYGYDPADPARAAELIDLLGLADGAVRWTGIGTGTALFTLRRRRRLPLLLLRVALSVSEHSDSLDLLAHRAVRHYRARAGGTVTAAS